MHWLYVNYLFQCIFDCQRVMLTKHSSFILKVLPIISAILFQRVTWMFAQWWQCSKKWEVDSISRLQLHKGLIQFWKLWLNLCSLRWLKLSLRWARILSLTGLLIVYTKRCRLLNIKIKFVLLNYCVRKKKSF